MLLRPLRAVLLSLLVSGCISGPRDFRLVSVQLMEFSDQPPPLRFQLLIEFTTKVDLLQRSSSYVLGARAYFCDRPTDNAILSGVRIYFPGQPVSGDVRLPNPGLSGAFTYATYVGVARQAVTPSIPPEVSYDLRIRPEDICFYVAGGNATPFGFKSNIVRVPKDAIFAALSVPPK